MHKLFKTSILTIAIISFSLPLHAAENNQICKWKSFKSANLPNFAPKTTLMDRRIYDEHRYSPNGALYLVTAGSGALLTHLIKAFQNNEHSGWRSCPIKPATIQAYLKLSSPHTYYRYYLFFTYQNQQTLKDVMFCYDTALDHYNDERFTKYLKPLIPIMRDHFGVDKETTQGLSTIIAHYAYEPLPGIAGISFEGLAEEVYHNVVPAELYYDERRECNK